MLSTERHRLACHVRSQRRVAGLGLQLGSEDHVLGLEAPCSQFGHDGARPVDMRQPILRPA